MTPHDDPPALVEIPVGAPVWDRFFTVAPLVIVGTREGDGHDLAPKHMAMPFGRGNWFCFACSHDHRTQRNARATGAFTVSFPRPGAFVATSLTAAPRQPDDTKPTLAAVPVFPARVVDGVLVRDATLWLECRLDRIVDGYGKALLVIGEIVAAAVAESAYRDPDTDDADLLAREPPLAYLHPGRFAEVADTRSFPFPAGFGCGDDW